MTYLAPMRKTRGPSSSIVLTEANQAFLDTVASIRDQGITGEEAVEILNAAVQGLTAQE